MNDCALFTCLYAAEIASHTSMKKKLINIAAKKVSFLGSEDIVLPTDLASDGSRNNIVVMLQQVDGAWGVFREFAPLRHYQTPCWVLLYSSI